MKTLAIRLDDELHAQLSVLAQLRESTITDEIRMALESHLEATKASPDLAARAQGVLDEIERDSRARQAAIATLFGTHEASASFVPASDAMAVETDEGDTTSEPKGEEVKVTDKQSVKRSGRNPG